MRPLDNSIAAMEGELAEWRRWLHRHPELGYHERETSAFVAEKLRAFGLDVVETGLGVTGVVGVLHGARGPGGEARTVMLRADFDALPIEELTGLPHASQNPGRMHACGHDGHTTMLLGAAKRLAEARDSFDGTVIFVFQPAEEGGAGAKAMLDDGLMARFPARAVYGMHNEPGVPVGHFAIRPGPCMAMADEFRIEIVGKGGHAAMPNVAIDPIVAGSALVQALQSIVSRRIDPVEPAVLSVTQFHAGTTHNVIPETAFLSGTVRAFDEKIYRQIHDEMAKKCAQIGAAFDVAVTVTPSANPYPPTVNDPAETEFVQGVIERLAGPEALDRFPPLVMGGEDFAYLAKARPGAFVFIGNGDSAPLHHPLYDFNDATAPHGVALWTRLVAEALPAR
jgi:hippurate hydrolase